MYSDLAGCEKMVAGHAGGIDRILLLKTTCPQSFTFFQCLGSKDRLMIGFLGESFGYCSKRIVKEYTDYTAVLC